MRNAAFAIAAAVAIIGAAVWLLREPAAERRPTPAPDAPTATRVEIPTVRTGSAQLTGRVRVANGEPAANAWVEVIFADRPSLPPSCAGLVQGCGCFDDLDEALDVLTQAFKPLAEVRTAADGTFQVTGLPAGRLEVRAHSETTYGTAVVTLDDRLVQVALTIDRTPGPFIAIDTNGELVEAALIAAADGRFLDFARVTPGKEHRLLAPAEAVRAFAKGYAPGRLGRMRDAPVARLWLEKGQVLRGTLAGASGPIAGQLVRAVGRDGQGGCATAITGPDGAWTLGPLTRDRYRIEARRDGQIAFASADAFRPKDGGVDLKLTAEVVVKGKVVDGKQQPLEGAGVEVTWFPLGGGSGVTAGLVTGTDGTFEHRGAPGSFSVSAKLPPRIPAGAHSEVESGEWSVTLKLADAAAVRGKLSRADGQPLVRPMLSVHSRDRDHFYAELPRVKFEAGGVFSVDTLPGSVDLDAWDEGTMHKRLTVVAPADDVRITLDKGGSLVGKVVDETGAPVKHARVTATGGPEARASGFTEADGAFALLALPDGPYDVTAQTDKPRDAPMVPGPFLARAERTGRTQAELKDGRAPPLLIRLEPTKSVKGRVVDEAGRAVPGVGVGVRAGEPPKINGQLPYEMRRMVFGGGLFALQQFVPATTTGPDGTFVIEGLPDAPHLVQARGNGVREDSESPPVVRPGMENVVVVVRPQRQLAVPVRAAGGEPLTKVLLGGEEVAVQDGVARTHIVFTFTGPLAISAPGYAQQHVQVAISPRADTTLPPVTLVKGRTLKVAITDQRTGDELDGWLSLDDHWLPQTKRPGEFTVPPGAFTARVGAADHVESTVSVAADQAQVSVVLDPGAVVLGPITDATGKPLRDNECTAVVEVNGKKAWGAVLANGTYAIRGVGAGRGRIWVQRYADQKQGPVKDLEVPATGSVTVPLTAP